MITQQELIEFANYNKDTGIFTSNTDSHSGRWKKGRPLVSLAVNGYIQLRINKKQYTAHRLAFLYVTGSFPKQEVDHINQNRSDNRWCNLREVSHQTNRKNNTMQSNNKSGVTGVYIKHYKTCTAFIAEIRHNGKKVSLGSFRSMSEAKEARMQAELDYGYHENHGKKKGK